MIQARYPKSTWTDAFTDGSAENAVRNGGSGAYTRPPDGTTSLSIPAGDLSSNYRAELHALKAAKELLIEEDCNQQNIVLLSDSLSALQSLTNGPTDLRTKNLSTSYKEAKTFLKQKQKSAWRLRNNGNDPQKDQINTLDRRTQTTISYLCTGHCGLRNWVLMIQPTVNVALRSKLLSTFFRPAHTWRQNANSSGQKTLKWAPSSGGKLPNLAATGLRI